MSASSSTSFVVDDCEDGFNEVQIAKDGINMVLNSGVSEAQILFEKYKQQSPLMSLGSSFVQFMQALMTFEDDKLSLALESLQDVEKRCSSTQNGFLDFTRRRWQPTNYANQQAVNLEDKWQKDIAVADSLLLQAILTFINQDLTSYVKGGWILRKAWKVYDKIYPQIKDLHDTLNHKKDNDVDKVEQDVNIPLEDVNRLLGAISFGYGLLQLCMSLIPPRLLKLMELLGFEGDRTVALETIYFSSDSEDMKAPLAKLCLLHYHTVLRPFFSLDGRTIDAGVESAEQIIENYEQDYPKSSLFLFYKGRIQRLKRDIDAALASYRLALDSSNEQREIQLLCLHEIGWCNFMMLNWREAMDAFSRVKSETRWSKCFYTYLLAICQGALGDVKGCHPVLLEVPSLAVKKNNQIETFCSRRASKFKTNIPTQDEVILLGLEVLYLWNAFPMCTDTYINNMIEECNKLDNKQLFHVRCLIEGALYRELGDNEFSQQCFKEAIARCDGMKGEKHVAAFALYEIGIMLVQDAKTIQEGKKYLQNARDKYKDYDFENRLGIRLHSAIKQLKDK